MPAKKSQKRKKKQVNPPVFLKRKWVVRAVLIFLVFAAAYQTFFASNTSFDEDLKDVYFSDTLSPMQVKDKLIEMGHVKSGLTLGIAAGITGKLKNIKTGLFEIPKGSSNLKILSILNEKPDEAVQVIIPSYFLRNNLLKGTCEPLDIKWEALRRFMHDPEFDSIHLSPLDPHSSYCMLIPDTLWIKRKATADEVAKRLYRNYQKLWTKERRQKADSIGLEPHEVVILASIVYGETKKKEEFSKIAGVYMNRLKKDMRLQADPTVVFATGDYTIRRVLRRHKRIRSPYNTYRVKGLPPGPVHTPQRWCIDSVLNYEKHEYIYFVASPMLDGTHLYSKTLKEHNEKVRGYRRKLNRLGVFR